MLCPDCKTEIPEGKLLCPGCGKAIQIVPDFEPNIEDRLELSKRDIEVVMTQDGDGSEGKNDAAVETKEIPDVGGETKEIPDTAHEQPSAMDNIALRKKERSRKKVVTVFRLTTVLIIAAAVALGVFALRLRRDDSYDSHMKKAVEHMTFDEFDSAVDEYLLAASKEGISPEEAESARLGAANAYYHSGRNSQAVDILKEILQNNPENRTCYEQLIKIYESEGDIIAINDLISSCPVSEIYEEYRDYIALPPDFSTLGGEYAEEVELSLTALDGNSDIYYTIDGSIPDEKSEKYEKPIILTQGSYIISAVCINKKGYKSAVISEEYTVTHEAVKAPSVEPKEGKRSTPANIRAKADDGLEIYYTDDGTEPSLESKRYEGEIPMPLGRSTFTFVAADGNGNLSEAVSVSYDLQMIAAFSPEDGINYLLANLVATGKLLDVEGHTLDGKGIFSYKCDSCCISGSRIYYMIDESLEADGEKKKTGNIYALDFATLELYKAVRDADGNFTFEMLTL